MLKNARNGALRAAVRARHLVVDLVDLDAENEHAEHEEPAEACLGAALIAFAPSHVACFSLVKERSPSPHLLRLQHHGKKAS